MCTSSKCEVQYEYELYTATSVQDRAKKIRLHDFLYFLDNYRPSATCYTSESEGVKLRDECSYYTV